MKRFLDTLGNAMLAIFGIGFVLTLVSAAALFPFLAANYSMI